MSNSRPDSFLWNVHAAIVEGTYKPGSPEDRRFLALALCGEVGELANVIKKEWRGDNDPEFEHKLDDELGDVYAYLRLIAVAYNRDLDEIMQRVMIPKIKRRWGQAEVVCAHDHAAGKEHAMTERGSADHDCARLAVHGPLAESHYKAPVEVCMQCHSWRSPRSFIHEWQPAETLNDFIRNFRRIPNWAWP